MYKRILGRSGLEISAMGMGCWAIGGPFWNKGQPVGWGKVDDSESIKSLHRALDLGITFFDTAGVYGCGHSERILGQAIAGQRENVVIATKFGQVFDEETRQVKYYDYSPEQIRLDCESSLRRLNIDVIDLFQLHVTEVDPEPAIIIRETLEELVKEGKIRFYGWSTDNTEKAKIFAEGLHCAAVQQQFNIFEGNEELLSFCEEKNLASVNRSPLSMGLLTGKFSKSSKISADDVRIRRPALQEERVARLEILEKIKGILSQDGRTLAQGALGWLWARSAHTIPIPGFKTIEQVEENIGAANFGLLSEIQMNQITAILRRTD
jgi:aryl-alcohol dehydrogenase-like predicted oxidoreductase